MTLKSTGWRVPCLFLVLIFAFSRKAEASHVMGADFSYICLGNNQYSVTLRLYRDCCGIPVDPSYNVDLYNGCTNTLVSTFTVTQQPGSGQEVSELCPAQLSQSTCANPNNCPANPNAVTPTYPGVQVYIFTGIITLPSQCASWFFRFSTCCRNASINNITAAGFGIEAMVNNMNDPLTGQPYCNSSVAFSTLPVPFVCLNSNVTYNNGGSDVNGDSLVYALVPPLDDFYAPTGYNGGYSVSQPITTNPPNSFQFDSSNGQIAFTPPQQEIDVLAIQSYEFNHGVLVGTTMRDIQVSVLPCVISIPNEDSITGVQNGNQADSLTVQVCPGTAMQFDIICTDAANHNLTLTSNISGAIPGATLTQIGTGDTVIARVNWTPLPGDTGCHNFILTSQNDDCPINGTYTRVYYICVFNKVQLLAASPTFCGTPVQLSATGGTNFSWSPTTGLNNPNILNPLASPAVPTMYHFTSDCGTDSVLVNVAQPFVYDAGPGGNICQNGLLDLNATTDNMYAPYTFHWVPATGLFDPVGGQPNDTIPNPVASPLVTTEYYCYFTGSNGCINIDSLLVTVVNSGPNIVAKAQPQNICPGDTVQLNIVTNPQSCGLTQTPCNGHVVTGIIGTGIGQTPWPSPTQYPTIYGHYSQSARHQFLYLQPELLAQLGSGGSIDSISFYLSTVNSPNDTMKGFTIKMGCTQVNDLNSWQPNLVTVFNPKDVLLGNTTGWKTHKLDFPYDWDGSSNLVVDICFMNPPSANLNNMMQMTPTTFNSVYYSRGNTSQCGNTGVPHTSLNRPNTQFTVCITDITGMPIAWTPNGGANAAVPANIINPISTPISPTVYHVDVTAPNGCVSSDFILVNVDTSLRFRAFPHDTFFCSPTAVTLTTSVTGNPLPGDTFSYQWTNLTTNTAGGTGASITVNPASSTDYLVQLSGGACTLYDTVHVRTGNSIPINLLVDSITCFGANNGVIIAQPQGGNPPITYTWSNGGTLDSITNLGAGTYSVSISDAQGCTGTSSAILTEPTLLTLSGNSQNSPCAGNSSGSITLTPNGGTLNYSYAWNPVQPNSPTLTNLGAGNYDVTLSDAHNCTATATFTIVEPPLLTVTVTPTNASCDISNDGQAASNVQGGVTPYTYTWDGNAGGATIANLTIGNHNLLVTDANGCTVSSNFLIDTMYVLHVTTASTDATCFGNNDGAANVVALNGTAPYSYLWTPTGLTTAGINTLVTGNYSVVVTDNVHCTATGNVTIAQPTQIVLTLSHTDPTCSGFSDGTVSVTAMGGTLGYNYNWLSTPAPSDPATLGNLAGGVYDVAVTDAHSCSVTGSVTVVNPPSLNAQFINRHEITCANASDGTIEVNVTGGTPPISYIWSNGVTSNILSNLNAGIYVVTVSDNNGCDTIMNTSFLSPPPIYIDHVVVDSVSCPGYADGTVQISAIGGTPGPTIAYEYSMDGTNYQALEFFTGLSAGTYHFYIRDSQGCLYDTIMTVYQPVQPAVTVLPQDSIIEMGQSITLYSSLSLYPASSINFYSWSPITGLNCTDSASVVATPYFHTQYTVTINYSHDCSVSQTVTVYVGDGLPFYIPNTFTPNGDGNNDVFNVYGEGLSTVSMTIYNRWGEKIFDSQNQWLGWDGKYKGILQNPGVYTYYVNATFLNGKTKEQKGSITLMR